MNLKFTKKELWRNLITFIFSLVVFLSLFEIGIRSFDVLMGKGFFSNHRNVLDRVLNTKPIPFRTLGFPLYANRNGVKHISSRHEELFPLNKTPGTFRIVCFGGSTTENFYVFREVGLHYPLYLQSLLRQQLQKDDIEVINVGRSAYAVPHSLILLELDVLSWKPDLVILSHNINDLMATYWPGFTFDYSHKYSHPFYLRTTYLSNMNGFDFIFQNSQVYWFLKDRLKGLRETIAPEKKGTIRRKSYGNSLSLEVIETFERNLRSFVTVAQKNHIEVILATQPLQTDEEFFLEHWANKSYNDVVLYPLHHEFVQHHLAFNKSIQKVANETNTFFLDNAKILNGQKKYFIDNVHYTEEGVKQIGESYSNFFIKNNIINK